MGIVETVSNHKGIIAGAVAALVLVAGMGLVFGKKVSPVGWGLFGQYFAPDGVALGGFDPVSYQSEAPRAGAAEFSFEWAGATWRFASAENLQAFQQAPERYAPRFGGFCAFAVSKGFTASSDPKSYVVREGQLYLFNSDSIRSDWVAEVPGGIIDDAVAAWARR